MKPLAAALALTAAASGKAWSCLALSMGAWVIYWRDSDSKETAWAAITAGGAAAAVDIAFGGMLLWYLRPEWPGMEWAFGPMAARSALIAVALEAYLYVRRSRPRAAAGAIAGLIGFVFGFCYEALGVNSRLWLWNSLWVPDWTLLGTPLFVPFAWGTTFAFSGYYFSSMEKIKRRLPAIARPLGAGLKCGAALGGFLLIYLLLLRMLLG